MVFYTAAATTLQRLAPAGTLGHVMGIISTAESATETISMPLAGALVAIAGIRPGAVAMAAVAVAAGAACLAARTPQDTDNPGCGSHDGCREM